MKEKNGHSNFGSMKIQNVNQNWMKKWTKIQNFNQSNYK